MKEFQKRCAIVTGATGLLGTAITQQLLSAGMTVIATSRNAKKLEAWKNLQKTKKGKLYGAVLELSDPKSISKFCAAWKKEKPTILIANASCRDDLAVPISKLKHEDFRHIVDIDVTGHFLLARTLVESMPKNVNASIVFLSSIYGEVAVDPSLYPKGMTPTPVHYAVAKGALTSLATYLAGQWGAQGVRVNTIIAGGVRSKERQSESFVKNYAKRTMLGRMAEPEEIAKAAAFLASDDASYITGSCLYVDGGFTAR